MPRIIADRLATLTKDPWRASTPFSHDIDDATCRNPPMLGMIPRRSAVCCAHGWQNISLAYSVGLPPVWI